MTTESTPARDANEDDVIGVRFRLPGWLIAEANLDARTLAEAARESFLVNLYRVDSISYHQLGKGLGLSRLEVLDVLKRHQVSFCVSPLEMEEQAVALRRGLERKDGAAGAMKGQDPERTKNVERDES